VPASPCRTTELYAGSCCHGKCLEPATHAIEVQAGADRTVEHLRCPEHLAWSQEHQAQVLVRTKVLT